ncbi:LAMI_0H09296g1_1 [Lachancea mirantina]|uniref:LAMI_0H09296g1_1 n=1 Tax=Lachancea mirantina TaxID=1230905 RepID=A0A1G4KG75_9SACH|nr:LAMI_0H09296g1_1 [Lachancea mirantina]
MAEKKSLRNANPNQATEMALARRVFSTFTISLKAHGGSLKTAYRDIIGNEYKFLEKQHRSIKELTPYEFSREVLENLSHGHLASSNSAALHNRIIENLAEFDFSVACLHAKELSKLKEKLSDKSLIRLIQGNSGRVESSWSLFEKNLPELRASDDVLRAVLQKVVYFDACDVEDRKDSMTVVDVARALYILGQIRDTKKIAENTLLKILYECLRKNLSAAIPFVISKCQKVPRPPQDMELSSFQLVKMFENRTSDLLETDERLFLSFWATIARNEFIAMSGAEKKASQDLQCQLHPLDRNLREKIELNFDSFDARQAFNSTIRMIREARKDDSNFEIAQRMLRYLGSFKGDLDQTTALYTSYVQSHPTWKPQLSFELFLSFVTLAYRQSEAKYLAQALDCLDSELRSDIRVLRALVVAYSKFDITESLSLFNKNISGTREKRLGDSALFESTLLVEALVLAYLANGDREFARVIFEGSVREKVFTGEANIKKIKSVFTAYGDLLDDPDFDLRVKNLALRYILEL